MARVNVEQAALTDPRYGVLGQIIKKDRWSALARMVVVWSVCQERYTYILPRPLINAIFDDVRDLASAIIAAGLGEECPEGIYLKGTRGRIEWLESRRENGRKGGRGNKAKSKLDESTSFPGAKLDESKNTNPVKQLKNPPAPAPAPALTPPVAPPPLETHSGNGSEPKKTRKKTATHMTQDWRPPAEAFADLKAKFPSVDIRAALPEFRDYWIGEGRAKADWTATFRNRLRAIDERMKDRPSQKFDPMRPQP